MHRHQYKPDKTWIYLLTTISTSNKKHVAFSDILIGHGVSNWGVWQGCAHILHTLCQRVLLFLISKIREVCIEKCFGFSLALDLLCSRLDFSRTSCTQKSTKQKIVSCLPHNFHFLAPIPGSTHMVVARPSPPTGPVPSYVDIHTTAYSL